MPQRDGLLFCRVDLYDHDGVRLQPSGVSVQCFQCRSPQVLILRRSDVDEIIGCCGIILQKVNHIRPANNRLFAQPGYLQIGLYSLDGYPVEFDQNSLARATTESFDAYAACAGVQIKKGCVDDTTPNNAEARLLDA